MPIGIKSNICLESKPIISPLISFASKIDKLVLPTAVGPTIIIDFKLKNLNPLETLI